MTLGPLLDRPVTAAGCARGSRWAGSGRVMAAPPLGRATTLHLSVRVDGVYVDPLVYLVDRRGPAGSAAGAWWAARRLTDRHRGGPGGAGVGGLCYRPARARVSGLQRTPVDGTRRCPLWWTRAGRGPGTPTI